jgi:uncharacterized phage infection (PIP) family protein YhgE
LRNNSLSIAVTWHINIGLAIMADNDLAGGVEQSMKGMEQSLKDGAVQLKEGAAQLAEQQKKTGARQLSGIAGAVHAAAEQLEQQLPGAATYVHDAAERIDNAASDLRNRNLTDIADSVRRLGHERPLALFGGAVFAGFVLTRFLKSGQSGEEGERWLNSERS